MGCACYNKNGDHDDNQLSNLQILCPNCHSQTDNFRALNISSNSNSNGSQHKRSRKTKLCPVCNINKMKPTSTMCRSCYLETKSNITQNHMTNINNTTAQKDLCPVCETNQKYITSIMCNECRKKEMAKNIPPKEELESLIYSMPFTKIGEMYGVTDNAIRKWCKKYDLPYRKTDIDNILRGETHE